MARVKSIEFNDASGVTTIRHGAGFKIPADRASASVTFDISETDVPYHMTVVLTGHYPSYDGLIQAAFRQLADTLATFGEVGKRIEASFEAKE